MIKHEWDTLWVNASIATCEKPGETISPGAIATKNERIVWVGAMSDLPADALSTTLTVEDCQQRLITPGLIDCHTHLVYAGDRANEFALRLHGATYADIAKRGGGIQATVRATRAASEETLFTQSLWRAETLQKSGVTTLEIKSGYGLDLATELKMLRVAKNIAAVLPLTVKTTFLGAHTIPIEYRDHADAYVDLVCNEMIPIIATEKLADAVDVFCETIAFNLAQTERVFQTAEKFGLGIKCHAEQLSNAGSAQLAAKYHALSVEHLEFLSEEGVAALARAGVVAVLLPGAFYFLRETQLPPIEWLRQANVPIALASDCNPGTSPLLSLQLVLNMACTLFRLTPEEALLGVTKHAAKALGMEMTHGTLLPGKQADFILWNCQTLAELSYYFGGNQLHTLVHNGKKV